MAEKAVAVGIDPSLTSTGLVVLSHDGQVLHAEALRPPKGTTGAARLSALLDLLASRLRGLPGAPVAALEGYGYSAKGQRLAELGEWVGLIKWYLWRNNIAFFVVAPARLKKFVTGKGTAQKDEMRLAAYKRWAFEWAGPNDVVDAYGLARLALGLMGVDAGLTKEQKAVVTAVRASEGDRRQVA